MTRLLVVEEYFQEAGFGDMKDNPRQRGGCNVYLCLAGKDGK